MPEEGTRASLPSRRLSIPDFRTGASADVFVWEAGTEQFAARLRKVAKERRKWARREQVACYRVYDADLPDYAVAIDYYEGAGPSQGAAFAVVAEYRAPKEIDPDRAARRFADALAVVPVVLGVPDDHVFARQRRKEKGGGQYRTESRGTYRAFTSESSYLVELDFGGYLDTGLFLDHRTTRKAIGSMARGKRFLNLFAYTGTATLHAAGGGAKSTMTVDLSKTYLDRAQRNMEANGFNGSEHRFVQADVIDWIVRSAAGHHLYDLVFVDPPTFSNSKSMGRRTWDVQRDHVMLLKAISQVLAHAGTIVFSCNLRDFQIDEPALIQAGLGVEDVTARTIPHDFERNPRIHSCFIIKAIG